MIQPHLHHSRDLTHRANLAHTRYGWLRLTPAYSVHLVEALLETHVASPDEAVVLDPFCGTGTTALVCAEKGIRADTCDINPFLVWLAYTKAQSYSDEDLRELQRVAAQVGAAAGGSEPAWMPPLHQIEKWWDETTLHWLSHLMQAVQQLKTSSGKTLDLLKIAFCRVMISHSNASFNHQSMSFKPQQPGLGLQRSTAELMAAWDAAIADIAQAAQRVMHSQPRVLLADARQLATMLPHNYYTNIITSPPYPNRMSYIRELRPYMYWLGYLESGRAAGELDWQAIGGTWGCATSNLGKWVPPLERPIPYQNFAALLAAIARHSPILSRYVHKYFYDMVEHSRQLFSITRSGGTIHYIVGNSRFYDVLLPVEEIFAALFAAAGFVDTSIKPIRKRTSKKELYEFVVSARKP